MELISVREFARRDGCDEKMVRKMIEAGALARDASGKLDAALVGTDWRPGNRDRVPAAPAPAGAAAARPSRRSTATRENRPARSAPDADQRAKGPHAGTAPPPLPDPEPSDVPLLAVSARRKEHYLALQREQEYRRQAGELVDLSAASQVLFEESRRARDAILQWPGNVAALLASDLGLEPGRVADVLTTHVRELVASLGEPDPGKLRRA